MDQIKVSSETDWLESTELPQLSISSISEAPSMTITAILGITFLVIVAIVAVFVFGILIDSRKPIIAVDKMDAFRKHKKRDRSQPSPSASADSDQVNITTSIQEIGLSEPPVMSHGDVP